jgi:phenylacetate-CoA ligase
MDGDATRGAGADLRGTMSQHYDTLETRSTDQREADQLAALNAQIARAGHADTRLSALSDLTRLPVLRKSDLTDRQKASPPFGGLAVTNAAHVFQSPGPIYEPGGVSPDWWRMGRFLHALGIGPGDTVQNCFSYHFVPAGMIFESGARAVGARVFPAGTGQTELQVRAAVDIGCTAYAGTPDYLKIILDKADEMGERLAFRRAAVGGGALFPSLRAAYAERGIDCRQCYATADLGNIAYETAADGQLCDGMVIDEGVIVEIVRPGTGDPVPPGEVGEVVVTSLNPDYPLIRFATGDMSAILPGASPCGRTNARIRGWLGRADQTTKIKGMFVRPEQVAAFVSHHPEVGRARVVASREGDMDVMTVLIETRAANPKLYEGTLLDTLKLRGKVELVPPGSLPNDGKVIEDRRSYD